MISAGLKQLSGTHLVGLTSSRPISTQVRLGLGLVRFRFG